MKIRKILAATLTVIFVSSCAQQPQTKEELYAELGIDPESEEFKMMTKPMGRYYSGYGGYYGNSGLAQVRYSQAVSSYHFHR